MLICSIRFLANVEQSEKITLQRKSLGLLILFDQITLHIAIMIWKIINNKTPEYLKEIQFTNDNSKLIIQKPNSNAHNSSLYNVRPKLWNSIPDVIKENKYKTFGKHLFHKNSA